MCSFLGFFLPLIDLLIDSELAALDGHQDVCVLCRGSHELCHDKLSVLTRAHAQGLESLKTVLIVNLKLLKSETGMLNQVTEESGVLDGLDNFLTLIIGEVLDGNTCEREKGGYEFQIIGVCARKVITYHQS